MPPRTVTEEMNDLYPDRRDERRARFKATKIAERLAGATFQVDGCVGGRTVTVSNVAVDSYGHVTCLVTHPDLPMVYPDLTPVQPFEFWNPSILHPDGHEDLVAAGRKMVRDTFQAAMARF